ncbi:MAG: cytochrome C [Gallionella sp.]
MKLKIYPVMTATVIALIMTNAQAEEPLELRKVMKGLGKNMQIVTDGISREDWALVESTSHLIAEHPQPPLAERVRIMSFMGTNMGKFKGFDGQTHESANEMVMAAREKNGQKVISIFQKLQSSCLACHQAFRSAFVENFYGISAK